jgi:hypothetical protein
MLSSIIDFSLAFSCRIIWNDKTQEALRLFITNTTTNTINSRVVEYPTFQLNDLFLNYICILLNSNISFDILLKNLDNHSAEYIIDGFGLPSASDESLWSKKIKVETPKSHTNNNNNKMDIWTYGVETGAVIPNYRYSNWFPKK